MNTGGQAFQHRFSSLRHYGIIIMAGLLLFVPFLGRVHLFDWDEINFAEAAREMIVTGDWARVMIDYQPFLEKPPLFFWLQAASMKVFGITEFAARFPNAICGILTLCLLFFLGKKYFAAAFGWLWVLAYAGSFLPHFYFKSGIIDPWFNLFIFSAIAALVSGWFGAAGIVTGLAILTKGHAALLIVILTAAVFSLSQTKWLNLRAAAAFLFTMLLVSSLWFGIETVRHGTGFLREFIRVQADLFTAVSAGYGGPLYYHVIVLLLGCFPASIIALGGFFSKHAGSASQLRFRKGMIILFTVVLVVFSIAKTKVIHYSSLCYLPLTFLAAWEAYFRINANKNLPRLVMALLLALVILCGGAAALLPYFGNNTDLLLPFIKDAFARAALEAHVEWNRHLAMPGILYAILGVAAVIWLSNSLKRGTIMLFTVTAVFIQAGLFFFTPRIERYTQGAAIDFYKSLQGKDVYVQVYGFKSYAHLFYSQKQPPENPASYNKEWLLHGEIDKPAYFVSKITKAQELRTLPYWEEIESKNGFVFFKRNSPQALPPRQEAH